jgi:hypothetical protein
LAGEAIFSAHNYIRRSMCSGLPQAPHSPRVFPSYVHFDLWSKQLLECIYSDFLEY